MVIVVGGENGDPSSNTERSCLHSHSFNALGKGINTFNLLRAVG